MSPDQLSEWNRTELDYPRDSTIAEVFKQRAALTPEAIALVAQGRQLSYREVDERSNRIARRLRNLGVKPETLVGVSVERSEALVISLLAVLKAGGAYVPLDPSHPAERLQFFIEDSGMNILLTSNETRASLPSDSRHLTILDVSDPTHANESPDPVPSTATSRDLAYIIYTSGSSGRPKGVMIENRNVLNFSAGMDRAIGCEPGTWLAITSFAFDISVLELLWTLTRGFKVVVNREGGTSSIADDIAHHGVTHLQMTPSLARMLVMDGRAFSALGSLKVILLGGEAVPSSLIHFLRQAFHGEIYNMYGPTETTIWSTTYRIDHIGNTIPIGRPIANTQIYLLDDKLTPVSLGERGELFIGGEGVARGYWNRPELTAEAFLDIPSLSSRPIYRTGDFSRLLGDGDLEYLGRADFQIKLRGHRIEPGEIEALLEQSSGVRQAVVVLREDREADPRLVAYLVADSHGPEKIDVLKSGLSSRLPKIMIPSAIVFLPELPLTANGKIDRKALLRLPPPGLQMTSSISYTQSESAGAIERVITHAWQEALGISEVGVNDNFFDLGAHSLAVAEVQAKLQNVLGREIPLLDLFQFSTVRSLADHLAGKQSQSPISDRAERRRLTRQR